MLQAQCGSSSPCGVIACVICTAPTEDSRAHGSQTLTTHGNHGRRRSGPCWGRTRVMLAGVLSTCISTILRTCMMPLCVIFTKLMSRCHALEPALAVCTTLVLMCELLEQLRAWFQSLSSCHAPGTVSLLLQLYQDQFAPPHCWPAVELRKAWLAKTALPTALTAAMFEPLAQAKSYSGAGVSA